jgi:hypothetical protein
VSSSDWLEQSESLTCGSRSTVSVDQSTVNVDRVATGLGWAWARPDLGRTGPATCQAQVLPHHLFGFKYQARAGELGSRWTRRDGPWTSWLGSSWTRSISPPSLLWPSCTRCTEPPSRSLLLLSHTATLPPAASVRFQAVAASRRLSRGQPSR